MPSSSTSPTLLSSILLALLLQTQSSLALHIGKASPCYDSCDGGALTETKHLSCLDAAYDESSGTAAGKQMRECLTCAETSSYANASDTETDQYWFMFHLKYTQQYCLFDSAATQIDDCAVQCSPLQSVLTTLWGNSDPPRYLYDYCSANSEVYPNYAPDCATCLKNRTGTVILGNFMETMFTACDTQPNITTDSTAFFEIKAANGDLFASQVESATGQSAPTATDTNASLPTPTSTDASTTGSAQQEGDNSLSSSSSASAASSTSTSYSGLSTAASIGIGVGVSALAVSAIIAIAFWILRRRRVARSRGAASAQGFGGDDDKAGFISGSGVGGSPSAAVWGQGQGQQWSADPMKQGYGGYGRGMAPVEMSAAGNHVGRSEMPGESEGAAGRKGVVVAELSAEEGGRR